MAYGRRGGGRRGGGMMRGMGMRGGGRRGGRRGGGGMPGGGRIRGGHSVPSSGIYGLKKRSEWVGTNMPGESSGYTATDDLWDLTGGTGSDRITRDWSKTQTPGGFQPSAVSADDQFMKRQVARGLQSREYAKKDQTQSLRDLDFSRLTPTTTAQARPEQRPFILDPSSIQQAPSPPVQAVRVYDPPLPSPSTKPSLKEFPRATGPYSTPSDGSDFFPGTDIPATIVAPSIPVSPGIAGRPLPKVIKVPKPRKNQNWPTPQAEAWGILGIDTGIEFEDYDPEIPRTAFAVLFRGPYILLLRRSRIDKWQPGKWSFPGGHVNVQETLQDGVAREILEEAGLAIATPMLHPLISFTGERGKFVSFFAAHAPNTPVCRNDNEHDLFAWVHPEDLWKYPLAPNVMTAIGFALGINPKLLMKRQRANQKQRRAIWRKVRV
jgi:8-oxo-dGTP diphosphatase